MFLMAISFIGVFIASLAFTPIYTRLGLVDTPNNRKKHIGSIPLVGGLAMFTSTAVFAFIFVPATIELTYLLTATSLLVMVGTIDDKYDISFKLRLAIQLVAALLLIYGNKTELLSLGNIFGLGDIALGWLSVPITIFAIIGIINAYNMIDGMDGLSAGLGLISMISIYALTGSDISEGAANILRLIIGALTAYLILNLHVFPNITSKIFMGDAGSMLLGFIICAFLIRYSQGTKEVIPPIMALWLVAIPLMDIILTTARRVRHGKSPFHPDRTHIHHIFQRARLSKWSTLTVILSLQALASIIGSLLYKNGVSEVVSLISFFVFFYGYSRIIKNAFKISKWIRSFKHN